MSGRLKRAVSRLNSRVVGGFCGDRKAAKSLHFPIDKIAFLEQASPRGERRFSTQRNLPIDHLLVIAAPTCGGHENPTESISSAHPVHAHREGVPREDRMAKRARRSAKQPMAHTFIEDLTPEQLAEVAAGSKRWREKFAARKKVIHHAGRITKALLAVQVK